MLHSTLSCHAVYVRVAKIHAQRQHTAAAVAIDSHRKQRPRVPAKQRPGGITSHQPGKHSRMSASKGKGVLSLHNSPDTILDVINDSTKWVISAAVSAIFLWQHNIECCWCIMGSIICAFMGKALKFLINQQRPPEARKADPGMPSSHATSLSYLGVYSAGSVLFFYGEGPRALLLVAGALGGAIFLSWLRVAQGYHTWDQVIAGWLLGTAVAASWMSWGLNTVLPAAVTESALATAMYAMTAVGVAAFAGMTVRGWIKDKLG